MYVYRNEVFNRRGYIHTLYPAEMSALSENSQGAFFYGTVYSVKHILSTMSNLYTIFRTFSLHAAITKQSCRMLNMDAILFPDYTTL